MTTVGTHALAVCEPEAYAFADDGLVPNNVLPLLVYRAAMRVGVARPEEVIEERFAENGWGAMWRNGVYDYLHYHATVHEALAVARGRARVQFGGERGKVIEMTPGDVAILPACRHWPSICLVQQRFRRDRRLSARAAYGGRAADPCQSHRCIEEHSGGRAAVDRSPVRRRGPIAPHLESASTASRNGVMARAAPANGQRRAGPLSGRRQPHQPRHFRPMRLRPNHHWFGPRRHSDCC